MGVSQIIALTRKSTWHYLADATRLLGGLGNQAAAKSEAGAANRRVSVPPEGEGVVAIMGQGGFDTLELEGARSRLGGS